MYSFKMTFLLVTVILYLLSTATAQDCTALANAGNCDFYTQCVEERFQCGSNGYPLGYGDTYCRRFQNQSSCFTSTGQQWIDNTNICLMKALLNSTVYQSYGTCNDLTEFAFESHHSCYTDNKFCTDILLNNNNLRCLSVNVIDHFNSFRKIAFQQVYHSAIHCSQETVGSFLTSANDWIADAVQVVNRQMLETLQNLLGSCTSSPDIMFILDASGSVGTTNFITMKNFMKNFISNFSIGNDRTRVGVISFSSSASIILSLGSINNINELNTFIDNIVYTGGNTATNLALDLLSTAFNTARTNQGIPRVAIVFTDGQSNEPILTAQSAQLVHSAGITVYSFGIGDGVNTNELNTIATSSSNVLLINSFSENDFATMLLPLRTKVCSTTAPTAIGSPINVNLQTRETRLLQYTFPNEGLTLTTDLTQGQIQIYGSFSIHNPTALTADFAVRSSHLFISTELYMSTINSSRISKHQSLTNSSSNVYILLTALQSNTAFSMNTTFGDTTPPPRVSNNSSSNPVNPGILPSTVFTITSTVTSFIIAPSQLFSLTNQSCTTITSTLIGSTIASSIITTIITVIVTSSVLLCCWEKKEKNRLVRTRSNHNRMAAIITDNPAYGVFI